MAICLHVCDEDLRHRFRHRQLHQRVLSCDVCTCNVVQFHEHAPVYCKSHTLVHAYLYMQMNMGEYSAVVLACTTIVCLQSKLKLEHMSCLQLQPHVKSHCSAIWMETCESFCVACAYASYICVWRPAASHRPYKGGPKRACLQPESTAR